MNHLNTQIHPYELYVITGPMKSGKSKELFRLLDRFSYLTNMSILALKPDIDTRKFEARASSNEELIGVSFTTISAANPQILNSYFKESFYDIVILDECQFFSHNIVAQIDELMSKGVYVICSGLDLDFRGETFGPMGDLLARAQHVSKLSGICEYEECNNPATRTQREINGKPAHYNSPIILVGDEEEGYSCRCFKHHVVNKDSLNEFIQ
ncbi:MAG: thymidine kinase [Candidatus Nanoarchaeia archaeon]